MQYVEKSLMCLISNQIKKEILLNFLNIVNSKFEQWLTMFEINNKTHLYIITDTFMSLLILSRYLESN